MLAWQQRPDTGKQTFVFVCLLVCVCVCVCVLCVCVCCVFVCVCVCVCLCVCVLRRVLCVQFSWTNLVQILSSSKNNTTVRTQHLPPRAIAMPIWYPRFLVVRHSLWPCTDGVSRFSFDCLCFSTQTKSLPWLVAPGCWVLFDRQPNYSSFCCCFFFFRVFFEHIGITKPKPAWVGKFCGPNSQIINIYCLKTDTTIFLVVGC